MILIFNLDLKILVVYVAKLSILYRHVYILEVPVIILAIICGYGPHCLSFTGGLLLHLNEDRFLSKRVILMILQLILMDHLIR